MSPFLSFSFTYVVGMLVVILLRKGRMTPKSFMWDSIGVSVMCALAQAIL